MTSHGQTDEDDAISAVFEKASSSVHFYRCPQLFYFLGLVLSALPYTLHRLKKRLAVSKAQSNSSCRSILIRSLKTVQLAFRFIIWGRSLPPAGASSTASFYKAGQLAVESSNAHKAYTSASTYKMFIVTNILSRINSGTLNKSVLKSTGFKEMILHSQNGFAESYLSSYGLSNMNSFVKTGLVLTSVCLE